VYHKFIPGAMCSLSRFGGIELLRPLRALRALMVESLKTLKALRRLRG
jgi:hypothetical protein